MQHNSIDQTKPIIIIKRKVEWEHLSLGSGYATSEIGNSNVGADTTDSDGNIPSSTKFYSLSHTSSKPREVISIPANDFAGTTYQWLKIYNYYMNYSNYSWRREIRIYKIWLE